MASFQHLIAFETPRAGFGCDGCKKRLDAGLTLHGCRSCNYDLCGDCLATSAGLPNEWKQAANCPKLKHAAEYEYRVRNKLTPGMRIQSVMNVECHVVDAYLVSFITRDKQAIKLIRLALDNIKRGGNTASLSAVQIFQTLLEKMPIGNNGKFYLSILEEYVTKEEQDANPTKTNLKICKSLYAAIPSDQRYRNQTRKDLVKRAANQLVRKWATTLDSYLQRYLIDKGPPIHTSATCQVFRATDLLIDAKDRVALKIMSNEVEFNREIKSRYGIGRHNVEDCTIGVLGWHIPEEATPFSSNELRTLNMENRSRTHDKTFVLVMEMGSASLYLEMTSQRIAGHDKTKVTNIFRTVTERVRQLHFHKLIHSDIKPRNILRKPNDDIVLCDLDAALPSGTIRDKTFKCSSAYCPPEQAQFLFANGPEPLVTEKFDVWSLGVLLYELCTGQHLFSQDISDDNMTSASDKSRLCVWYCITEQELLPLKHGVFKNSEDVKSLIRWCLQGNPAERPTIQEVLNHPFLLSDINSEPQPQSMKYHAFISHMQIEASGTVGTIYFMLEQLGCHLWRDMNQKDLTEAGMKQGVLDSDVFILFLTNSMLSRPFCLKEIEWAINANKPIVIVAEEEERFWPFDFERWQNDECTKDTTVWPHVWKKSEGLGSDYASCPANIKAEIHRQHEAGLILPYRRRDFEANAMILQVLAKAGELGCDWAKHVPKDALKKERKMLEEKKRKLLFVCDKDFNDVSKNIANEMREALNCRGVEILPEGCESEATHALVILTGGLLSSCPTVFDDVIKKMHPSKVVFVYSFDAGWDFGAFYKQTDSSFKASVGGHEALVFRTLEYEKKAMMDEILRRLRPDEVEKKETEKKQQDQEAKEKMPVEELTKKMGETKISSPKKSNEEFEEGKVVQVITGKYKDMVGSILSVSPQKVRVNLGKGKVTSLMKTSCVLKL